MAGAFTGTTFDALAFHVDGASYEDSPVVYVSIGGILRTVGRPSPTSKILASSLAITDNEGSQPTRARGVAMGFEPLPGQRLVIALGGIDNPSRLFAGTILSVEQTSVVARDDIRAYRFTALDDAWRLSLALVTGRYTGSASDIVAALMTEYAPDVSLNGLVLDLPALDGGITFTLQDLASCLTAVANRIGGYWYVRMVDPAGDLAFYLDDLTDPPVPLTPAHPTLVAGAFALASDLGTVVTRATFKGGGSTTGAAVAPGETILPVRDAAPTWYGDGGGAVIADGQRLTYTGSRPLAGGALVGTGASPSGAVGLAGRLGTEVNPGDHDYAVTFETAVGESVVGPRATIRTGLAAAPAAAVTLGAPTTGGAADVGAHDYVATFVGPSGTETTGGPASAAVTTVTKIGALAPPTAAAVVYPFNPDNGVISPGNLSIETLDYYKVTFVNAQGETTGGPDARGDYPAPAPAPTAPGLTPQAGGNLTPNKYYIYFTVGVAANGYETNIFSSTEVFLGAADTAVAVVLPAPNAQDLRTISMRIYRTIGLNSGQNYTSAFAVVTIANGLSRNYLDTLADSGLGAEYPINSGPRGTDPGYQNYVNNIPLGGPGTTARRLYRATVVEGPYLRVTTINDNVARAFTDNVGTLGPAIPVTNTTGTSAQTIPISQIPLGPPGTVARRLYRRFNAAGAHLFAKELANNTGTSTTDAGANSGLGAAVPVVNTVDLRHVFVSNIPIGSSAVIGRRLWRTAADAPGLPLRLVAAIPDNVTDTYLDAVTDAALGAAAPTADTSGLSQPTGQVIAGSTSMPLASVPPTFADLGGWAVIGNGTQFIRYFGLTANALIGIPASGPGSIVETVAYNSNCSPAGCLIGIPETGPGSVRWQIARGVPVDLVVTLDDLEAQALIGALMVDGAGLPTSGVFESADADGRLGLLESTARAAARLVRDAPIRLTARYASRDLRTRAGQTIVYNFPPPINVVGTLVVQEVEITFPIMAKEGTPALDEFFPLFTVRSASSQRFTFEDLLRRQGPPA